MVTDYRTWTEASGKRWVTGNDLPPGSVERLRLDEVYHTRLQRALAAWRTWFGSDRVDSEEVDIAALLRDPHLAGSQAGLIAMTSAPGASVLDCVLIHTTADFDLDGHVDHVFRPLRQFEKQNLIVASCLSFPDAFNGGGVVAHRLNGMIGGTRLLYDRLAFPIFRNDVPRFLLTVSGYLRYRPDAGAAPATPKGHGLRLRAGQRARR